MLICVLTGTPRDWLAGGTTASVTVPTRRIFCGTVCPATGCIEAEPASAEFGSVAVTFTVLIKVVWDF